VILTEAQRVALRWFKEHNGDGLFAKDGVLLAAGERAGLVEKYEDGKRLRVTA
jgi:hypothetical protein